MLAAGPMQTGYSFKNKAQRLLEGALGRKMRYVNISDGEVKLEARRSR
jgi:hypothetical protein